jgi:hypothetical protein
VPPSKNKFKPSPDDPPLFDRAASALVAVLAGGPEVLEQRRGGRRPEKRREFAGNPEKYIRDVLGWKLVPQQEEVCRAIMEHHRVLIPSGNNVGKTFLLGAIAIYFMDAEAALSADDRGSVEQGCILLLPGPTHDTVKDTIYAAMMEHCERAEKRGYAMPGNRSEKSVLWRCGPRWFIRSIAPSKEGKEKKVAHAASGRHHRNQIAIIEEGMNVAEPVWKAVEGMCSGEGNRIISGFNPTEPAGSAYERARARTYKSVHLSALDHPNVRERKPVVPEAISFKVIDMRVRTECQDLGEYPKVQPDKTRNDFVYAMPPTGATETGGRDDGIPGHPHGDPHVYRPEGSFVGQVLGAWPITGDRGLFDAATWDAAVERWKARKPPPREPDVVGVDVAREGDDTTTVTPRWGAGARTLLEKWADLQQVGDELGIRIMRTRDRVYVGRPEPMPKGDGYKVASALYARFQDSPLTVDEGGVGSSVLDILSRVMDRDASGVSFGSKPDSRVEGESYCFNMRTQLYHRAALLVARGLVDVPDDPILREEVLAHWVEHTDISVRVAMGEVYRTERKPALKLPEKKKIKEMIGRSPDRADSFVLSLFEVPGIVIF